MDFEKYLKHGAARSTYAAGPAGFLEVLDYLEDRANGRLGLTVMDVGAGNLEHTMKMRGAGFKVTPVDYDPQTPEVEKADMHDLRQYGEETLDFIVCHHTFEHAVAPLIVLSEFFRLLKHNGKAIIVVPDDLVESWFGEKSHVGLISEKLMRLLCMRVGFTVVHRTQICESSVMWVLEKP